MHRTNHPYTEHLQASVWDVDPVAECRGRPVGLAWFSPDCKHFSKLMGGKVYTIPVIDGNGAYVDADIEVEPSWVECQSCHAMGQTFDETDEDPENAVAAWNRRV